MRKVLPVLLLIGWSLAAWPQSAASPYWHVRLTDGSNDVVLVQEKSGQIEFRKDDTVLFAVPVTAITDILLTTQRVRRADTTINPSDLWPLLSTAISAPFPKSRDHFVEIRWFLNAEGGVIVSVEKNDYQPFLEWLKQVSGKNWLDADQEREHALKEIDKRKGEAFPVVIERPTPSGNRYSGSYLVLPFDFHGRTQLLFFDGSVREKNVVGMLPVSQNWSDNGCVVDSKVLYRDCGEEGCRIEAILLPTVTYRINLPAADPIDANRGNDCSKVFEQESKFRGTHRAQAPQAGEAVK